MTGSLANDTILDLLAGRVKSKGSKDGLRRAKRLADRAPEVMVMISG